MSIDVNDPMRNPSNLNIDRPLVNLFDPDASPVDGPAPVFGDLVERLEPVTQRLALEPLAGRGRAAPGQLADVTG